MRTFFLLLIASVLYAEQGPAPHVVRFDQHGDALPRGALARFGTMRWHSAEEIEQLVYTADEKNVLALSRAGVAEFNLATGTRTERVRFGTYCFSMALAPDGRVAYAVDGYQQVRRWDVATGKELPSLSDTKNNYYLTVSSDSKTLAVTYSTGKPIIYIKGQVDGVRLFDIASGKVRDIVNKNEKGVLTHPVLSPDASRLVCFAQPMDSLIVLDLVQGEGKIVPFERNLHRSNTTPIFTPDSRGLVVHHFGKAYYFEDARNPKEATHHWNLQHFSESMVYAPDGKTLYGATAEGITRSEPNGEPGMLMPGGVYRRALAVNRAGTQIVAVDRNRVLHVWDIAKGERLYPKSNAGMLLQMQFAPDSTTFATRDTEGTLCCWGLNGREQQRHQIKELKHFQFSLDGQKVLTIEGDEQRLQRRSVRTFASEFNVVIPSERGTPAISSDGTQAVFDNERQLRILNLTTQATTDINIGRRYQYPYRMGFLRGGRVCVGEMMDTNFVRLWAAHSGNFWKQVPADTPPGGFGRVWSVSHDERLIVSLSDVGQLTVWDAVAGSERCTWATGIKNIVATVLGVDTSTVAVYEGGGPLRFYRVGAATPYATINVGRLADSYYPPIVFAPDGQHFATEQMDGTALLWRVPEAPPLPVTTRPFAELWDDLKENDASKVFDALQALRSQPKYHALIAERLQPVKREALAKLLADLDNNRFAVREKASKELIALGAFAGPVLQETLDNKPSADLRERLEAILKTLSSPSLDMNATTLQALRGMELLEQVGTPEARKLMEQWAVGGNATPLSREATESLQRMKWRKSAK